MDSLFFKKYSIKISNFFSTGSTGPQSFSSVIIYWSMSEFGSLGLVLTKSLSSELGIMHHFFMHSLLFKEYSLKISNFLSTISTNWQPVQPAHWVSLYRALILVILEAKSYMAWAHKLQIDLGQYCGSILVLGLGSLQPTMNHMDSWWWSKGVNVEREAHLVTVRSVYGADFRGWWGHFPERKQGKTKVEVGEAGVLV